MAAKAAVIVVSGPSGVGKSTVVDNVLRLTQGIERSVSVTTRKIRGSETDGVEYHFVDMEEFQKIKEQGLLLESAEVHGNLYGTSATFVESQLAGGTSVLLEIDVQGAMLVKKKWPEALLIFVLPPSLEELEKRLRERGTDDDEVIATRLKNAELEIERAGDYDFKIVNDDLEDCVGEMREIILGWIQDRY